MSQNDVLDIEKLVETDENGPLQIPKIFNSENRGFTIGALTSTCMKKDVALDTRDIYVN
jgi:hypothetical protein